MGTYLSAANTAHEMCVYIYIDKYIPMCIGVYVLYTHMGTYLPAANTAHEMCIWS
jgi:hypothetical protein